MTLTKHLDIGVGYYDRDFEVNLYMGRSELVNPHLPAEVPIEHAKAKLFPLLVVSLDLLIDVSSIRISILLHVTIVGIDEYLTHGLQYRTSGFEIAD